MQIRRVHRTISVGNHNPDVLQIVRSTPNVDAGPHTVETFDGKRLVLETPVPDLNVDELVLVYNDGSEEARGWILRFPLVVDDLLREVRVTVTGPAITCAFPNETREVRKTFTTKIALRTPRALAGR